MERHGEPEWTELRNLVERASAFQGLTPRELDVVCLIGKGLTNYEIAGKLFISPHTVKNHLTSIYRKTGMDDRTQLAILVERYWR